MKSTMKIRAIITGASGMVGEGILHECLQHPAVEHVLVVGRKPCGTSHPKMTEILHPNFQDIAPLASQLVGYNACYFGLGVSSIGMNEPDFHKLTYDLTIHFAEMVAQANPDLTFCYVSGSGTDSSETGRTMWARVKGKTENRLVQIFGRRAFNFRPGYMHPTPGLKNTLKSYRWITWMYPFAKAVFPGWVSTLADLGRAMLQCTLHGYPSQTLEVEDIKKASKALTQEYT